MLSSHAPMRFWRIQETKADLIEGRVGERETFRYIFASLVFLTYSSVSVGLYMGQHSPSWNWVDDVTSAFAHAIMVYIAFRANGGASGRNFAARYFAISWVLGIRFYVGVVPLVIGGVLLLGLTRTSFPAVQPFLPLVGITYLGLFYWRLYVHVKEVAAADSEST
ncbi:MAG: hypothetical protein M3497_08100 [Gemmatimonadota bacterium]|nr:hypothetical protein [Gemmatimonadota bacterium]